MHTFRVPDTCELKNLEIFVGQLKRLAAMATSELGAPRAMSRIPSIVQASNVVKECK